MSRSPSNGGARAFVKMHGLGNDFVVVDARQAPFPLDDATARRIADRHRGVGCDQLLVIEPAANGRADAFLRIRNYEGAEVEACGNGTRCVAALLMAETKTDHVTLETVAGLLVAEAAPGGAVSADMGEARFGWRDIPLAREMDTLHLDLALGPLSDPVATSMGNPHATFFVDDLRAIDMEALGPKLEHDPLFPQRANIGVAQVTGPDRLRLRVWERGVGLTLACGSGACAAAVAACRRGLTGRRVELELDGGPLSIEWREDGHVVMTGPVATAFTGSLPPELLRPEREP
ncbi:MAG: diaminopimelate epimerase [Kiloniellales bacterium]